MISPQGHKKQTYSGQRCSLRCFISTSRTVSQASGSSGLSGGASAFPKSGCCCGLRCCPEAVAAGGQQQQADEQRISSNLESITIHNLN